MVQSPQLASLPRRVGCSSTRSRSTFAGLSTSTSPLDGAAERRGDFLLGSAGLVQGKNYRIVILDGGTTLAIFGAGQNTSVSGDVSSTAIGGSFQFTVRVQALGGGGQVLCTDDHLLLRASLGAPPQPTPTPRRRVN
ncbi:MAG: hypothetical protein U0670_02830 [Anaerolineae bacterium]